MRMLIRDVFKEEAGHNHVFKEFLVDGQLVILRHVREGRVIITLKKGDCPLVEGH